VKTRHGKNLHGRQYAQLRSILKARRVELGLSQRDLSALLRRHKNFVQLFEAGEATLDVVEMLRYVRTLKLDARDVVGQLL
jgi:ribosome-binding protein aMBF1 (putative translation factor)